MKNNKWLIYVGMILLGALAGYIYWYYIGCNSGTCPLTSSWKRSSLTGGFIGYLLSDTFINKKERKINSPNDMGE